MLTVIFNNKQDCLNIYIATKNILQHFGLSGIFHLLFLCTADFTYLIPRKVSIIAWNKDSNPMNGSHSIRSSKPLGAPSSYFLYPKISSPIMHQFGSLPSACSPSPLDCKHHKGGGFVDAVCVPNIHSGVWYPELVKDTREPGICHRGFQSKSETYWPGDDFVQITTFSSLHFLFTMDVTGLLWGLTQV